MGKFRYWKAYMSVCTAVPWVVLVVVVLYGSRSGLLLYVNSMHGACLCKFCSYCDTKTWCRTVHLNGGVNLVESICVCFIYGWMGLSYFSCPLWCRVCTTIQHFSLLREGGERVYFPIFSKKNHPLKVLHRYLSIEGRQGPLNQIFFFLNYFGGVEGHFHYMFSPYSVSLWG